jgi:6-phosphogluconolactonase
MIAGLTGCGESGKAKPVTKPVPSPTPPIAHTVGGTVSGLSGKAPGNKLILQLNGANDLAIASNGKFIFPDIRLPDGSDYSVSIKATPAKLKCTIKAASAAFDRDTLNIVSVTCSKKGRHK